VEVHLIQRPDDQSPQLIPGWLMKDVHCKREMTLTHYLWHWPGCDEMSPPPGMDIRTVSECRHRPVDREGNHPRKCIPLALKSSSQLNIQPSAELGRHRGQSNMTRKPRGLLDDQNCDEHKSKRFHLASMTREFLQTEEVPKRSPTFDYKDGHARKPKIYRLSI